MKKPIVPRLGRTYRAGTGVLYKIVTQEYANAYYKAIGKDWTVSIYPENLVGLRVSDNEMTGYKTYLEVRPDNNQGGMKGFRLVEEIHRVIEFRRAVEP